MSLYAKLMGRVSRMLPQSEQDTDPMQMRLGRFGDLWTIGGVRKQHALADEGSYFVTNNAQTGIATPAVATFGDTTPLVIIANSDSPGNQNARRIHLDYMTLVTTAAGSWASAGVNLQAMVYLDTNNRYSSGGTDLSGNIVSVNSDVSARSSVAKVYFGSLTASAKTGNVRAICGLRILRPAVSATVADVVGETKHFNFGGVEATLNGSITIANANNIPIPFPPLVIGPGHSAQIYFVMNGTTPGAVSYAPELGWWER